MFGLKKLIEDNKGFLLFLLGMLFVRIAIMDFYIVPSSSMYPTLLEGDRVVANRLAYDIRLPLTDVILARLNDPQRGDIVTFSSPKDGVRLIKRLIAVPGDVIELRDEKLLINGKEAVYQPSQADEKFQLVPTTEYSGKQEMYVESLGEIQHKILIRPEVPALRTFGPFKVPADQYFMMGDNRDNSADSRYIGFVKRELITGRVQHLFFSLDAEDHYLPRWKRFGASVLFP